MRKEIRNLKTAASIGQASPLKDDSKPPRDSLQTKPSPVYSRGPTVWWSSCMQRPVTDNNAVTPRSQTPGNHSKRMWRHLAWAKYTCSTLNTVGTGFFNDVRQSYRLVDVRQWPQPLDVTFCPLAGANNERARYNFSFCGTEPILMKDDLIWQW